MPANGTVTVNVEGSDTVSPSGFLMVRAYVPAVVLVEILSLAMKEVLVTLVTVLTEMPAVIEMVGRPVEPQFSKFPPVIVTSLVIEVVPALSGRIPPERRAPPSSSTKEVVEGFGI